MLDDTIKDDNFRIISMPYTKRIICLANSRKMSGRCIAGLEIAEGGVGGWIRPVSNRTTAEISLSDRRFEDGSEPELLDILEISMLEPRPHSCHTENHLIDDEYYWVKVGNFSRQRLPLLCEVPHPLWVNGFHSYNGINDRIPEAQADALNSSLVLVEPQRLRIVVERGRTKRQARAEFRVADQSYNLTVTDPEVERQFLTRGEGYYSYEQPTVACISISEPFQGYRYKLVASIIDL
jgi:hypothetical protein